MPTALKAIGQRSETVRRANLSAIIRELHVHGPASRSALVARTGLTRSAIGSLIGEFVGAGFVIEERAAPRGTPGRPSQLVTLDADRVGVIALEIAVDTIAVAVVGLGGEILELRRVDRSRKDVSVEATAAALGVLVADVLALPSTPAVIIGLGVAVAGVVRRRDGFVSMAPNLGWTDVPLGERLANEFGLPLPVTVANDAELGALAELRRGAALGVNDVVYISGEVGVGGGIISGGNQLTGAAGFAGEIGHLPVNPAGSDCRCGSIGCWETEIGLDALLVRAGRAAGGGRAAADAVLLEAEAGGPAALAAIAEVGRWLGYGLAGLVNIFNPALIVLGGSFTGIYPFVSDVIRAQIERHALPAPRQIVRVVPATLGLDAPMLGAAELAFEPFLADPAQWLRSGPSARLASA
ncbi:MAG: ROK family protein [Candidatus Limnocylindrales bacterium]